MVMVICSLLLMMMRSPGSIWDNHSPPMPSRSDIRHTPVTDKFIMMMVMVVMMMMMVVMMMRRTRMMMRVIHPNHTLP